MPTLTATELVELAAELALVNEQLNVLTQRADTLKATIRDGVPGPDTYAAGALSLVVTSNYRFSQAQGLKHVPPQFRALCVRLVEHVDGDKLKLVAPEAYWQSVTSYPARVSVR